MCARTITCMGFESSTPFLRRPPLRARRLLDLRPRQPQSKLSVKAAELFALYVARQKPMPAHVLRIQSKRLPVPRDHRRLHDAPWSGLPTSSSCRHRRASSLGVGELNRWPATSGHDSRHRRCVRRKQRDLGPLRRDNRVFGCRLYRGIPVEQLMACSEHGPERLGRTMNVNGQDTVDGQDPPALSTRHLVDVGSICSRTPELRCRLRTSRTPSRRRDLCTAPTPHVRPTAPWLSAGRPVQGVGNHTRPAPKTMLWLWMLIGICEHHTSQRDSSSGQAPAEDGSCQCCSKCCEGLYAHLRVHVQKES